jgi:N-acetylmuramoyl-L-alanine amidase
MRVATWVLAVWLAIALVSATPVMAADDPDPAVERVQTLLTDAHFFRGEIDGVWGARTAAAVLAFEKATGQERTGDWDGNDEAQLKAWSGPRLPDRTGDRMEIDLTNQLAYLVEGGDVVAIFGISSGNGELYHSPRGFTARATTPRGSYTFYRHIDGYRHAPLGVLYRPWYFTGGYAVHGSPSVPGWPASHGCVRVENWEADWLAGRLEIGMPVHLWDGEPIPEVDGILGGIRFPPHAGREVVPPGWVS